MTILEDLPCPQVWWLAWLGVPLELFQAIFLHPYFQLNYPKSTKAFRLLVIPICIYLAFATLVRRSIQPLDEYLHFNFGFTSMPTFHFVCLCIIFGFHQGPVFKSEVELFNQTRKSQADQNGQMTLKQPQEQASQDQTEEKSQNAPSHQAHTPPNQLRNRKSKSDSKVKSSDKNLAEVDQQKQSEAIENHSTSASSVVKPPSIGELTRWIAALFMSPRGLICTWSPPESVVPRQKSQSLMKFMLMLILKTYMMHIWFQVVCALGVEVVINSKGDVNSFLFDKLGLPPWKTIKFFSPYLLTVLLGGGAYSGFALAGGLFNIVEISIISLLRAILPENNQFRPEPVDTSNYPPLFNSPWVRESLTEFWGKGWQAVFRHHFLFCGAQPMYIIFRRFGPTIGKIAAVMGAMGLSAAMHEFCLASISQFDPSFSSSRMFLSQGVGIVLESIFKQVTGKRVGGFLGWFWTFAFMIVNGTPMVNAWKRANLGQGIVPFQEWGWIHALVPFGPLITDEVYDYLMSWIKIF